MTTAIVKSESTTLDVPGDEFPVDRLVRQKQAIQKAMKAVMKEGEHFGIIPGTPKPSLWQPGADTLCFLFRLRADYEPVKTTEEEKFIAFTVRCRLYHIDSCQEWGSGMGSANSREKKYSAQSSTKLCPKCGKPAIIRGKPEFGGGWLCFKKKDGCGEKYLDGDTSIESQSGEVQAAGVWDLHNTIGKMACKRAKVAAVLTATAASDCFTQDLEDLIEYLPPAPKELGTLPTPKAYLEVAPAKPATTRPTTTESVADFVATSAQDKTTVSEAERRASPAMSGPSVVHSTAAVTASLLVIASPKAPAPTAVALPPVVAGTPSAATATFDVPHDPITGEVLEESDEEDLTNVVPVMEMNERTQQFEVVRNEPKLSPAQLKQIHVLKGKLGHHLDNKVTEGTGVSRKTINVPQGKYRKVLLEKFGKTGSDELSRREGSIVIDRLLGMWERLDRKLDRGIPDRIPGSDDDAA